MGGLGVTGVMRQAEQFEGFSDVFLDPTAEQKEQAERKVSLIVARIGSRSQKLSRFIHRPGDRIGQG